MYGIELICNISTKKRNDALIGRTVKIKASYANHFPREVIPMLVNSALQKFNRGVFISKKDKKIENLNKLDENKSIQTETGSLREVAVLFAGNLLADHVKIKDYNGEFTEGAISSEDLSRARESFFAELNSHNKKQEKEDNKKKVRVKKEKNKEK